MKTFLIIVSAILLADSAMGANFQVIANQSVTVNEVRAADLKRVFLGMKPSVGGAPVEPVLAQFGIAHETFLSACIGKSDAGLRNYYKGLVFTGKGSMPRSFSTDQAIIGYVAKTKGAIGYVRAGIELAGVKKLELK